MKRRNFLIGFAGVTAISIPSFYYFNYLNFEYDSKIAEPESLSMIMDTETIIEIGEKYNSQESSKHSERSLAKQLISSVSNEDSPINQQLEERIKKDFVEGNTVIVNGWVLSSTEAKQCALFSLIQQKQ